MPVSEKFIKAAQLLEGENDEFTLRANFEGFLYEMDVEFYIYITVDQDKRSPYVMTNTGLHQDMAAQVFDPFLDYCCNSYNITKTGAEFLKDYPYLDEVSKGFILEAAKSGFRSGLGIPMRLTGSQRYGGFNLGTRYDRESFEEVIYPLSESFRLLCLIVHRRIEELQARGEAVMKGAERTRLISPPISKLQTLSDREREVLFLVSKGMTRKQCAHIGKITEHTVSTHLKKSYLKLGVSNKAEATRIMVEAEESALYAHSNG